MGGKTTHDNNNNNKSNRRVQTWDTLLFHYCKRNTPEKKQKTKQDQSFTGVCKFVQTLVRIERPLFWDAPHIPIVYQNPVNCQTYVLKDILTTIALFSINTRLRGSSVRRHNVHQQTLIQNVPTKSLFFFTKPSVMHKHYLLCWMAVSAKLAVGKLR